MSVTSPAGGHLPWPVYAVITGLSVLGVFVATKLGAHDVMPMLFAAIALGVNSIGHMAILAFDHAKGKPIHIPYRAMAALCVAIGLIIASNDVNAVFMFAADAPLSIATPVHGAAVVLLSVLFGVIFLHERTNTMQKCGLLCAVAGIVLLNV